MPQRAATTCVMKATPPNEQPDSHGGSARVHCEKLPHSLRVDEHGCLDVESINDLTGEALESWVVRRLHGDDPVVPIDPHQEERPHSLLKQVYRYAGHKTRERLEILSLRLLESAGRVSETKWKPSAIDELLLLVPTVFERSFQIDDAREALLHLLKHEVPKPELRLRVLQALVSLKHQARQEFWEDQFEQLGEQSAAVVLEGLALSPGRLKSAFAWLAQNDWSDPVRDAISDLLPGWIKDFDHRWVRELILGELATKLGERDYAFLADVCCEEGVGLDPSPPTPGVIFQILEAVVSSLNSLDWQRFDPQMAPPTFSMPSDANGQTWENALGLIQRGRGALAEIRDSNQRHQAARELVNTIRDRTASHGYDISPREVSEWEDLGDRGWLNLTSRNPQNILRIVMATDFWMTDCVIQIQGDQCLVHLTLAFAIKNPDPALALAPQDAMRSFAHRAPSNFS